MFVWSCTVKGSYARDSFHFEYDSLFVVHWQRTDKSTLLLAYQSFGIVFGDLCTSPIYVFRSTYSGGLKSHKDDDIVLGVLSVIFWTLTLIPLCKYVIFVLGADDNGEGTVWSSLVVIYLLFGEELSFMLYDSYFCRRYFCFVFTPLPKFKIGSYQRFSSSIWPAFKLQFGLFL